MLCRRSRSHRWRWEGKVCQWDFVHRVNYGMLARWFISGRQGIARVGSIVCIGETIEIGRSFVGLADGLGLGDGLWAERCVSSVAKVLDTYYTCGYVFKMLNESSHCACGINFPT